MTETAKKKERTGLYTFARVVAWVMTHTVYPVRIHEGKRMNDIEAPYILIANHDSGLDPIFVAHLVKKYEVRFIAKKELMQNKFLNWLFLKLHAIPVDRHQSDMMAMRNAIKVVRDGDVLGIFPEGTRHKKGLMQEIEGGVAIIALRGKVPIVPVYIAKKLRPFRVTPLVVGEPMDISDLSEKGVDKSVCDELLLRISDTYEALSKKYQK